MGSELCTFVRPSVPLTIKGLHASNNACMHVIRRELKLSRYLFHCGVLPIKKKIFQRGLPYPIQNKYSILVR